MAVDEWLFSTMEKPLLRVYRWSGLWGSVGYFGSLPDAQLQIPGRRWVRRWTGGGAVDHADDWTYTVMVPAVHPLCQMRGEVRYRVVHAALSTALQAEGFHTEFSGPGGLAKDARCFKNPVPCDLLLAGHKVAGAGQRRSKLGLMHQGSVALKCDEGLSHSRARRLAMVMCSKAREIHMDVPQEEVLRYTLRYETAG